MSRCLALDNLLVATWLTTIFLCSWVQRFERTQNSRLANPIDIIRMIENLADDGFQNGSFQNKTDRDVAFGMELQSVAMRHSNVFKIFVLVFLGLQPLALGPLLGILSFLAGYMSEREAWWNTWRSPFLSPVTNHFFESKCSVETAYYTGDLADLGITSGQLGAVLDLMSSLEHSRHIGHHGGVCCGPVDLQNAD